jgi:hypothetical protein
LPQRFTARYSSHQHRAKNVADRRILQAGHIRKRATVAKVTVAVLGETL